MLASRAALLATTAVAMTLATSAHAQTAPAVPPSDWPSYNRTLTSERTSPLAQITGENVGQLREVAPTTPG